MKIEDFSEINSESQLVELQKNFAEVIRRPLQKNDKMKADERTESISIPSGKLTPHARIEIYAQQYWWRIQQSFDEDFQTVAGAIPRELYLKLRNSYLERFPSASFTLRDLGSRFAAYVKSTRLVSGETKKIIYQSAVYDWSRIEAYDDSAFPAISQQDIESRGFASRKLSLQPYVKLHEFSYPVHEILRDRATLHTETASNVIFKQNAELPANAIFEAVKMQPKHSCLAVHRFNQQVYVKELSATQFKISQLLKRGISLKILDKKLSAIIHDESEFTDFFTHLMSLKWIKFSDVQQ